MTTICLNLKTHVPLKLEEYSFFDIGLTPSYIDADYAFQAINKISDLHYLPCCRYVRELIDLYPNKFKISFTVSGSTLDLLQEFRPDVLDAFKQLANTGNVEFVCQPFYSPGVMYVEEHFEYQVELHRTKIKELLGVEAKVLSHRGPNYSRRALKVASDLNLSGLLMLDKLPGDGSMAPISYTDIDNLYCLRDSDFLIQERDEIISEPVQQNWSHRLTHHGQLINVFMDFEDIHFNNTQGFESHFFNDLGQILEDPNLKFKTPNEVFTIEDKDQLIIGHDTPTRTILNDRNYLQQDALTKLYALENRVIKSGDKNLLHIWSQLQDGHHFDQMNTSHFNSVMREDNTEDMVAYNNYIHYMNILSDLELRVNYALEIQRMTFEGSKFYLKSA